MRAPAIYLPFSLRRASAGSDILPARARAEEGLNSQALTHYAVLLLGLFQQLKALGETSLVPHGRRGGRSTGQHGIRPLIGVDRK